MEIKLRLKVRDVEIELSTEEAKKLADALNALVGEKRETVIREYPAWPWRYPYVWYSYDQSGIVYTSGGTAQISDGVSLSLS